MPGDRGLPRLRRADPGEMGHVGCPDTCGAVNLSREMHDVVSHRVSLIAVQAGALRVTAPNAATVQTARTIRTLSVQTLDELRDMVGVLRSSDGQAPGLTPQPGIGDVEARIAASGIETKVTVHYHNSIKPSAAVQRTIYRTV